MKCMVLAGLLILAVPAAAQSLLPASITLPPELDRVLRDYEKYWKGGDEAALAALFTEDGFVPRSGGWVRGRDAIRTAYENSDGDLRLRAVAYAADDEAGYIIGAYGFGDEAASKDTGKFVLALRRSSGEKWLIAADLDQSNRSE